MANKGHKNVIGKGFDKRPENINRKGLAPRLLSAVNRDLEERGYTEAKKEDILSCYLRLIQLPVDELAKIGADKKENGLVFVVARNILSGKGFEVIEKILDRTIQKATQPIDVKGATKHIITFEDFGEGNLEME